MRKKQTILLHAFIWVAYFFSMLFYVDSVWEAKATDKLMYWLHWAASRFGDVGFSYFIGYFICSRFFNFKNLHWLILWIIGVNAIHFAYDSYVWNWFKWEYFLNPAEWQISHLLANGWGNTLIGVIFYANKQWGLSYFRKKKLEDEVVQTELKFLKAQMSPHFLFNVLNNIYSLSLNENENTSVAIGQLKSIVKYIQIFEEKDEITLSSEENHLQQYIALNRLRHPVNVVLRSKFENPKLKISPMLFLPFFENAFKHGKTGEEDAIKASLVEDSGILNFEISNKISHEKRKDDVSGVGLDNIKKRLPYLYRDFIMDVIQENEEYTIKIRINLGRKVQL